MRKSYKVLCGMEVTGQKLRASVKRHFEFRSLLQNHFSTYQSNIVHIVLNTVMLVYEVLMITVFLNLTTRILIETCRRLRGIFFSPSSRCPEEGDSWSVRTWAAFLQTISGTSQKTLAFLFG
jgi:hypothetical protein